MQSKLKNTILNVKRYQRHIKLAFIIDDKVKDKLTPVIINWCSFNVRGPGSLIFSTSSLISKFNRSLLKEHSPDFLVKVGDIPESTIKDIERQSQPFGVWDWSDLSRDQEKDPANLHDMLDYVHFPTQRGVVISPNENSKFSLLSSTLFGSLNQKQRESVANHLELIDVDVSSETSNFLEKQQFSGLLNLSRMFFWPAGMSFDSPRCYQTYNPDRKDWRKTCLVIGDIDCWDDLLLYWNVKAHFDYDIFFIPKFIFEAQPAVLRDFFWSKLREDSRTTVLTNTLKQQELVNLFSSILEAELAREEFSSILTLKKDSCVKRIIIDLKMPNSWEQALGKIKMFHGKYDEVPAYFSEFGGTVSTPKGELFDSKAGSPLYAIDFSIPFFKPSPSENLRVYQLGLGGSTRISSIGLTTLQGGRVSKQEYVTVRALNSIDAIAGIFADFGYKVRISNNGTMTTRFINLLKGIDRIGLLSGEDVVSFLKQSNPVYRNEQKSAVKRSDEVAAIDWGTIQRYFNIGTNEYLKKSFAEKIIAWMIKYDLVKVGTKVTCNHCFNKQWLVANEIKNKIECSSCFSELQLPLNSFHHLDWSYLVNLLFGRAIDQGFLTTVLTLHFLIHENQHLDSDENMTYFSPGIDVFKDESQICELDFFVVSEGEKIIGECKIGHDVTPEEISKLIKMGEVIEADVAVFSTIGSFSEDCLKQIKEQADKTTLKLVVLQKDELLNQAYLRQINHKRTGKSYRQIFVESVTGNQFIE